MTSPDQDGGMTEEEARAIVRNATEKMREDAATIASLRAEVGELVDALECRKAGGDCLCVEKVLSKHGKPEEGGGV